VLSRGQFFFLNEREHWFPWNIEHRDDEPEPERTRVAIDPDWLHDQYVTHRRTLTDLGHEVGLTVSQMGRRAKAYNIGIRPPGGSSHGRSREVAMAAAEFPMLRPALTDTVSWERLKRFAAAADHDSIRSAARTLGTHSSCLSKQIDRLERDLGGQLLIRTPTRYQRMQLTPLGTEITAAVRKALKTDGIDANRGSTATQMATGL
jgi:Bacterial regulatory helix-turn-helix protein, lysR family